MTTTTPDITSPVSQGLPTVAEFLGLTGYITRLTDEIGRLSGKVIHFRALAEEREHQLVDLTGQLNAARAEVLHLKRSRR